MILAFNSTCVYLLHFIDEKGAHRKLSASSYSAGHYVGTSHDLPRRLKQHRNRRDVVVIREVFKRGLDFTLARVIRIKKHLGLKTERELKRKHLTLHHCPICRIERNQRKLESLADAPLTPGNKQRITKAKRAIERDKIILREAQEIAWLMDEKLVTAV